LAIMHVEADPDRSILWFRILYERRRLGYGQCGVLHFGEIQRLACLATSASAKLLVLLLYLCKQYKLALANGGVAVKLGR